MINMNNFNYRMFFVLILLYKFAPHSAAPGLKGEITFRFVEYNHTLDQGANGNRCDGWSPKEAHSNCDPYFKVCIGSIVDKCRYLKKKTNKYSDKRHIVWRRTGTPELLGDNFYNPSAMKYREVPTEIKVFVQVKDKDTFGADVISTMDVVVDTGNIKSGKTKIIVLRDPAHYLSLKLEIGKTCYQNFYGQECLQECVAKPKNYSCGANGEKICASHLVFRNNICIRPSPGQRDRVVQQPTSTNTPTKNIYAYVIPCVCATIFIVALIITIVMRRQRQNNRHSDTKIQAQVSYREDRSRSQLLRDDGSGSSGSGGSAGHYERARPMTASVGAPGSPAFSNQLYLPMIYHGQAGPSRSLPTPAANLFPPEEEYAEISGEGVPPVPPPRDQDDGYTPLKPPNQFVVRKFSRQASNN